MKKWFYAIAVLIITILSELSWSIENLSVRSPVGSGTVPPTSFSSGLIQNPNPIDTSGNLIITGNVTGGKHFRGLVPYSSTTSFQGQLGTSSLDSFLRSSADSTDLDRYGDPSSPYYSPAEASTGGYRPFFSPTGTVTTTRAGLAGTLTLANTRIGAPFLLSRESRVADDLALPALPDGHALADLDSSALQMSLWPTSRTPQEMEKLISDELSGTLPQLSALGHLRSASLARNELRTGRYQDQIEQYRPELGRIDDKASLLKESLNSDMGLGERVPRESTAAEASSIESRSASGAKLFETQLAKQPLSTSGFASNSAELDKLISAAEKKATETSKSRYTFGQQLAPDGFGDYERSKLAESFGQRIDELAIKDKDYTSQDTLDKLREGANDKMEQDKIDTRSFSEAEPLRRMKYSTIIARKMGNLSDESNEQRIEPAPRKLQIANLSRPQSKDRGSQIGPGISLSEDKYNFYFSAAQIYLKQGRYYRAVDSFTLASIYKPKDPLAYVGKSHALFAAGEYISSALFLSRALQIMPEYARIKVDLADIVGDKDKLAKRISEAEERLQLSSASELQFLLGYIYYQLDRLDEAKKALEAAYEKLPDSKAVGTIKKAIDSAVAGSQPTIK